jgi:heat shock protein HspQ
MFSFQDPIYRAPANIKEKRQHEHFHFLMLNRDANIQIYIHLSALRISLQIENLSLKAINRSNHPLKDL